MTITIDLRALGLALVFVAVMVLIAWRLTRRRPDHGRLQRARRIGLGIEGPGGAR